MKHKLSVLVALLALEMWAMHGLYHLAEALGFRGYTVTFGFAFGTSWTGWVGHIIVEVLNGLAICMFLAYLWREGW